MKWYVRLTLMFYLSSGVLLLMLAQYMLVNETIEMWWLMVSFLILGCVAVINTIYYTICEALTHYRKEETK